MKTLNNNIQESYCSFEVSKLLKEKGFIDIEHVKYYDKGVLKPSTTYTRDNYSFVEAGIEEYCTAPTHAIAIEWIRVNFGIMIFCDKSDGSYFSYIKHEEYPHDSKLHINWAEITNNINMKCNTPQEATEAALLYVLTNLIK